jgi:membrane-bound ClpP family serine protease
MALVITLIVLGIVLLLAELIIIPGFGITGILGLLSLTGGVVMAYHRYGNMAGHAALIGSIIICVVFLCFALRAKTCKRLSLQDEITAQAVDTASDKGLVAGMQGVAITRLAPMGTVKINEVETEATTYDSLIDPRQKVEIVKIEGAKVFVKAI